MKKVIVTTTINPPTEAIRKFEQLEDWDLVVAGDLKTPADYKLKRGVYLSPNDQESYDKDLSDAIGWNNIQRRNFAFLAAHDMKADVIALVDDDNIPLAGWGENLILGKNVEANYYETDLPVFDPIGATNYPRLWHRGFPIQLVSKRDYSKKSRKTVCPDIQADFWNGDPDVDAVCRITQAPECQFDASAFPIASNAPSPFNSQNTFITADVLKDFFVIPHVGRMDDIWASYYTLAKGHRVVYNAASVYQARNVHDLTRDLMNEYVGYENTLKLVPAVMKNPDSLASFLPTRAASAIKLYLRHFQRS
jgi:hypothetical protein